MRGRSPIAAITLSLGLSLLALVAAPVTVACSCAIPGNPMQDAAAGDDVSVFTGVAGPLERDGVRVTLTRWFHGPPPPSGLAVLDPSPFADPGGASCGTRPPGAGTEWIFASWRDEVGRYSMNLCSTSAGLATIEGQTLLADAVQVFGEPIVPETPPPTSGDGTGDAWSGIGGLLVPILGILLAIVVIVGLFRVADRRGERT